MCLTGLSSVLGIFFCSVVLFVLSLASFFFLNEQIWLHESLYNIITGVGNISLNTSETKYVEMGSTQVIWGKYTFKKAWKQSKVKCTKAQFFYERMLDCILFMIIGIMEEKKQRNLIQNN